MDPKVAISAAIDSALGALSEELAPEGSARVRSLLLTLSDVRLASELSPQDEDLRSAVADMEQVVLIVMEQERVVRERARVEAVYKALSFALRGAVSVVVSIGEQAILESLEDL